jgi:beta-lactamase regulating signal transducer with metallopeptidase domain
LQALSEQELEAVVLHEHAHWRSGQWLSSHALFLVRMAQCYNPVALWVFREYCNEVEIACDAVAVRGRDPHRLARVLLRVYQSTDRRDVATRGSLRKRIDVLLAGGPKDGALPPLTVAVTALVMLLVLPWIV